MRKIGYYYYKYILKPGDSTKPIFTTIDVKEEANDIVLDGFDIYIYAESVQTVEGKNINDVWKYFSK